MKTTMWTYIWTGEKKPITHRSICSTDKKKVVHKATIALDKYVKDQIAFFKGTGRNFDGANFIVQNLEEFSVLDATKSLMKMDGVNVIFDDTFTTARIDLIEMEVME